MRSLVVMSPQRIITRLSLLSCPTHKFTVLVYFHCSRSVFFSHVRQLFLVKKLSNTKQQMDTVSWLAGSGSAKEPDS